ncbi:MAG: Ribonuclease BN [uncultured Sphingomonadaceae bacterium]|uniref:Ribonuclease BN n=1 Tax=uncultured Sphingomonadaceae bacterium TaxID=169976 RepID=A0A6J4SHU5_9SPHN|nr:MAG: Ribonuclease BN [uncultured Sphingomonadaceae bacterium]
MAQDVSPHSPEERRKRLARARAAFGKRVERVKPGTYAWEVIKRVGTGVFNDGFIHAGNLAYLALLTLFPFFIVAAAVARIFGRTEGGMATVLAVLQTMPPDVAAVISQPVQDVLAARSGNLLWFGALVGLWTTASFIETIRDILRRAYGVTFTRSFWEYRLYSIGLIVGAVVLLLLALSTQIVFTSLEALLERLLPFQLFGRSFQPLRALPAVALFGSLYLIFWSLTPHRYRARRFPKWPGPLFVTVWWLLTTLLLPRALSLAGGYDLTYGSLAGVTIALLFFFIIGLGVVFGAELNAALAETDEPTVEEVARAQAGAPEATGGTA